VQLRYGCGIFFTEAPRAALWSIKMIAIFTYTLNKFKNYLRNVAY
jgi:hypothetical protein